MTNAESTEDRLVCEAERAIWSVSMSLVDAEAALERLERHVQSYRAAHPTTNPTHPTPVKPGASSAPVEPQHSAGVFSRSICAWCGVTLGWVPGSMVSHGICRECSAAQFQKDGAK
jgi:hypothetical protein